MPWALPPLDNKTLETTINTATEVMKFTTAIIVLGMLIKPIVSKRLKRVKITQPKHTTSVLDREVSFLLPTRMVNWIVKGCYYFGFAAFFFFGLSGTTAALVLISNVVLLCFFVGLSPRPVERGEIAGLVYMGLLLVFVAVGSLISAMISGLKAPL